MNNNKDNVYDGKIQLGPVGGEIVPNSGPAWETTTRLHYRLLGHTGYGVTELRTFDGMPMVAYADNEDDMAHLCRRMDGKVAGIYVGVQPRPLHLFDTAPNCWRPARGETHPNCACDNDIEYIVACFFDIDVVSDQRSLGHPASDAELRNTLQAAQLLCRQDGLALSSTICCSGNGHYVLAPILPIPVDGDEVATQFRLFCQLLAERTASQVKGVKVDPVYNLSRVMRVMGTTNGKGKETSERHYRRACFMTEPMFAGSVALHHIIINADVPDSSPQRATVEGTVRGDLKKPENCEFVRWCREHPRRVSEPQWFGLISNLAHMEGGAALVHEISRLDTGRYDPQHTQRLIERIRDNGYQPINCVKLVNKGGDKDSYGHFSCSRIERCPARAPMFLAVLRTVYQR